MSKKILVIPLPENFWKAIALIVATGSTDALNAFKEEMREDYERDVIEFEAEVIDEHDGQPNRIFLPVDCSLRDGEKVKALVVQKESHEKDVPRS